MRLFRASRRAGSRHEQGAIAVLTALAATVVLLVGALAVDIGNTWARRGLLQQQADRAAMFAANYLPATTSSQELAVARAVAYYVACHPVAGQAPDLEPGLGLPESCPTAGEDPSQDNALNAPAQALLDEGLVSFPSTTQVAVRTPRARIVYGLGNLAGVDESIQAKEAVAKVHSPGAVMPMGGSLGCLATALTGAEVLGAGGLLSSVAPINYFSAGRDNPGSVGGGGTIPEAEPVWPTDPPQDSDVRTTSVGWSPALPDAVEVEFDVEGSLFATLSSLVGLNVTVWFQRGATRITETAAVSVAGSVTVAAPSEVLENPGQWHVKVAGRFGTTSLRQSSNHQVLSVGVPSGTLSDITDLDEFLACAKPMVSPRADTNQNSTAMIRNIREGLDHALAPHPTVLTALQNLGSPADLTLEDLVSALTSDPSGFATGCNNGGVNVLDQTVSPEVPPNCLRMKTNDNASYELTQGFLTEDGRLSCSVSECRDGHTFPGADLGIGGTYNDDTLESFRRDETPSLLSDHFFSSLDTYLFPSVPLVTPSSAFTPEIFESPRFFWAPVVTTAFTVGASDNQGNSSWYPILTFRPAFITQESPPTTPGEQLVNGFLLEVLNEARAQGTGVVSGLLTTLGLGSLLEMLGLDASVDDLLDSLGGGKTEAHGLLYDTEAAEDELLKAVRFISLAPGALPSVDPDYAGPVTEYLGVGPKIIRLVR